MSIDFNRICLKKLLDLNALSLSLFLSVSCVTETECVCVTAWVCERERETERQMPFIHLISGTSTYMLKREKEQIFYH